MFGQLKTGFFLYEGKLYYANQHGSWTLHYPVKDGIVQRTSDATNIHPGEMVKVLSTEDLKERGIGRVQWSPDEATKVPATT